ncbi:MAG: ShlB/FhaC/HecB family hemolysin secretion/activation protein [Betaproteobacteria bacterium]
MALLPAVCVAQVQPDAGRVQEQLRAPAPPPAPPRPDIRIEPPAPDRKADTPPFYVAGFRVTGATVFSEKELVEVLGPAGTQLTLAQIQERADRLTRFYNDRGYAVARALVPAQEVRDGVVEIRVLEGRYGNIDIRNATEVSEARIRGLLGEVREEGLIHGPQLERGVLLVSELAGIQPKATLEPGAETGTSDLVLEIGAGPEREYSATFDNAGGRFTGKHRVSLAAIWNSPANIGDRLSGNLVTSGNLLLSLRVAYELPIGYSGLRAGPYVSRTTYQLGDAFAALDASGTADAAGASASYPLIRSSVFNLRAIAGAEERRLEDTIGATATVNEKGARVLQAGLGGDVRDGFLAGAITAFQLQMTRGKLTLDSPALAAADAAGANTRGPYTKFVLTVNRIQGLSEAWRLSANYTGQWARKNLDSSEKFSLGGLTGVRAYPPGEASGDDAHLLQLELRHQGKAVGQGQFVPFGFFDTAQSRSTHDVFPGFAAKNVRHLAGYGVGGEWSVPGSYFARAWIARKAGAEAATADADRTARVWMQAGMLF